jgi:hypothetical protein
MQTGVHYVAAAELIVQLMLQYSNRAVRHRYRSFGTTLCFHSRLAAGDSRDGRGGRAAPTSLLCGSTGNHKVGELGHRVRLGPEPEIASGECSVVMVEEQGVVEVRLDCGVLGNYSDGAIRLAWVR